MTTALLSTDCVSSGYGRVQVIKDVSIEVRPGEIVGLVGRNGAGKTTTLLTLAGVLSPQVGSVCWEGRPTRSPLHVRARLGLGLVTEERAVFRTLSIVDNLDVAGVSSERFLSYFPELESHLAVRCGQLSGGQQQMVALGTALARDPRALLVDELSLGLAPMVVERLLAVLRSAAEAGCAVLLIEQHARRALQASDRVYVMRHGEVVLEGASVDFRNRMHVVEAAYFTD